MVSNMNLITPLHKGKDPLETSKYRPIVVSHPLLKLYAGILNARLIEFTESTKRAHSQFGFRPGLSTLHPVFILQHLIDLA